MLLAISADKLPLLFVIIGVLVVHYPLAVVAVSRLLKYKNKFLPSFLWHIIVQLLFIVGPVVCILIHNKRCEIKVYKTKVSTDDNTQEQKEVSLAEKQDEQ